MESKGKTEFDKMTEFDEVTDGRLAWQDGQGCLSCRFFLNGREGMMGSCGYPFHLEWEKSEVTDEMMCQMQREK